MPETINHIAAFTDLELCRLYKADGDKKAYGELFTRHKEMVYVVCIKYLKSREEAQDAVMQVFEKLLGTLKNSQVDNFKSWLYSVAKNHCLMELRAKSKFQPDELNENKSAIFMEMQQVLHPSIDRSMEMRLQELENALPRLNKEQRVCLELFYLKERSYQEVSLETGYSLNEVKSFLQNGKRNLKLLLEQKNE